MLSVGYKQQSFIKVEYETKIRKENGLKQVTFGKKSQYFQNAI